MRMKTNARFLLQMMAVSWAWTIVPVMSQTAPSVPPKATSAKAETCSFVPASADGKEQICVKAGAKAGVVPRAKVVAPAAAAATVRKPAPDQLARVQGKPASQVAKIPVGGLALKSATALKTPPTTASAVETSASKAGTATAVPTPTPVAKVQPTAAPAPAAVAAVPVAATPPATGAVAASVQQSQTQVAAGTAAETVVATAATDTVASTPKAAPPGLRKLHSEEAARRYVDGQEHERKGEPQAALLAYLVAAESGYGPAQKRLGDIYGTGTAFAQRDYGLALKWYERARAQGIEIPKPFTYSGLRP